MKILDEIEDDIKDVINTKFSYSNTTAVPSLDDSSLTFGNGEEKKAKILETCVLFVDIRNSVSLTENHSTETMGKIYTSLTKSVLRAARHHNGSIRNIIGDRVMVVFPKENCFNNAIECAITINHAATIINKQFHNLDFKCGIGVDYGELKVIKVGIARRDEERSENRGLVWVGYPANIASRLTDFANKEITEKIYKITKNPFNFSSFPSLFGNSVGLLGGYKIGNQSTYLDTEVTEEMSSEKFADSIVSYEDGKLTLSFGKFIRLKKENKKTPYPAILITKKVFKGLVKDSSQYQTIFEKQSHSIKNVKGDVYGTGVIWKIKK
ncbi:adenylate/guanylate cyclase domain-containing protein [Gillisia hiemivivida]|uniref:Adenylate/guanylate cyclase domain-containing protein n=1 Tax=Gillisia hiemivivida TaxID=291190 RepID=A0A5C6ZXU8_9FLAO|nr:adenylate/guanylate cyclase domain-containing protein [Gillisia hiemivivida]TXD95194.1 adenylate/guanylate cyclase domain-containing protein [Gillisia hiemivivida]